MQANDSIRQPADPARRHALGALGSLGVIALSGCGGGGGSDGSASLLGTSAAAAAAAASTTTTTAAATGTSSGTSSGTSTTTTTTTASSSSSTCPATPAETAGPYPADGSTASNQKLNALVLSGIVRSDIRSSVGSASAVAPGVPMTITLTLVNTKNSCAPLEGYAVYLWHCTRDGNYSLYSTGVTAENFLRGIQVSDSSGKVTFTTIFPGCYSGRWPHVHFEVYPSLTAATDSSAVSDYALVTQLAIPAAACTQVYGLVSGYEASVGNFANVTLASDNVFGNDSAALQIAAVSGSVANGFATALQVGVAV
ncbi:intradiol ring-cleavage dioxygenase [Variovorax sp. RT4R15]|uniref:dioxygenase family protein n=1 Tax=Variovorax sp. RT4R15 TaxID=3443737 RepID=UPI003F45F2E7